MAVSRASVSTAEEHDLAAQLALCRDVLERRFRSQLAFAQPNVSYAALLVVLDDVAVHAWSSSLGHRRIKLSRWKTRAVLELIGEKLSRDSEQEHPQVGVEGFERAAEAVARINALASQGESIDGSMWRPWFADVRRKELTAAIHELRTALGPFMADPLPKPNPPSS